MNDFRFAIRQLLKNPGFTAVAVLTLALGIGATTALFSVIYAVLISPYPYAKPEEIWSPGLQSADGSEQMRPYRLGEYQAMAKLPVFAETMATWPEMAVLAGEFAPELIRGVRVTGNAFQFLGVRPVLGRAIQPSDIGPGGVAEPVAVLSFKMWERLYGSATNVLGRTLRWGEKPYTIVGVMPSRFGWWTDTGFWVPLGTESPNTQSAVPILRLRPGVTPAVAQEQLHVVHLELAKANPSQFPKQGFTTLLTNYLDITSASGPMERSLKLLFGAVGFLLLIACANVANLQLAKATARAREMAVRLALGARRSQLIRQLLTESVLVSLVGGLLGLLLAFWITNLMVALMPSYYVPNEARIEVNRYVLFFCVLVSVLTGILFGLVPALQSSRANLVETLKDDSRGSSTFAGAKTRGALVIAEVALSVVLLVSAGLTIRSFVALQQIDLGFRPERVMVVGLPLSSQRYASLEQRNQFAKDVLERVSNLPGVAAATVGNGGLPFGGPQSTFAIDAEPSSEARRITMNAVSSAYLQTMSIPLRRGRMLSAQEIDSAQRLAVINEAAVKLWPGGEDPIGRRMRLDELVRPSRSTAKDTNASPYVTIVGVMGDTRNDDVRNEPQPSILIPYTLLAPLNRTLAVRTHAEPASLMNTLRAEVRAIDQGQPMSGPTTLEQVLSSRTAQPRFTMVLFSLFAGIGLALATAGIYSVLSYLVSMRTREIGVRIALGAGHGDVLRLIFRGGGRLVGIGLLIGIFASIGAARLLNSQLELFQVNALDPISFASVLFVLIGVSMVACFIPARRATKVDPTEALRCE